MVHAVLLGRDSWMRFNSRSYRPLPPRPSDHLVFGELGIVNHAPAGASAYAVDPVAICATRTMLTSPCPTTHKLLAVSLVRSNGCPALTGQCLVHMMPESDLLSVGGYFVASGRQRPVPRWCCGFRARRHLRSRPRPTHGRCVRRLQRDHRALISPGHRRCIWSLPLRLHFSQLQPRPRLRCLSVHTQNSARRSCASGHVCCYICERQRQTFAAQTGRRKSSNRWGMFFANFLMFLKVQGGFWSLSQKEARLSRPGGFESIPSWPKRLTLVLR